jgi:signal transduction histidine kinase
MPSRPQILVVDDVAANRLAIRTALKGLDVDIVEADNGFDALVLALEVEFALVLLDVQMPEMDGFEVCEQLRASPQTADTPVIFISAVSRGEQDRLHGYLTGATDYLAKPINDEVLKCKVQIFLRLYLQQRELQTALMAANAANQAKSAFLANMSHEIRTPMNAIVGMASILRREGVTPKQEQRLATIDTAAQHLLTLIDNILDLSKIEAGKRLLEEAPVQASRLMANVSAILSERARAKGIQLLTEADHLPHNLMGDPAGLQQAILNFATNAIKFTEAGTVTLRAIQQDETPEAVVVRFEVTDTGVGIAPDALARLFHAFEQADNSITRKYGGTGLGLAIARRLAELMGGQVGARSEPGVGSTFWLEARLKKGTVSMTAPPATLEDTEAAIRRGFQGQRVLIADDEPINVLVLQLQLEAVELLVDAAENGADALAMAHKHRYAAIFMDMQMPKLNGLDATRQIRLLPEYDLTPIIAMTANAFAEDKARCLEAGMSDFLTKPLEPLLLLSTLLGSLSRRDGQRDGAARIRLDEGLRG